MKRKLAICFLISLAFVSCGTKAIVYDNTIPEGDTATIQPAVVIYFNSFDGEVVRWRTGIGIKITIPSGEHTLTVGLNQATPLWSTESYSGGNYGFSYDFIPEHSYFITFVNKISENEIIIAITDRTDDTKEEINAKSVSVN
jgi:hypothetical protein